jgi:hypothetical protein
MVTAFPEPDPPSFAPTSPIESGWNGETHLGGWDDGLAVDHSPPSLGTSVPIPRPDEDNDEQGWSSPHFSDPDHNDASGDDWGQPKLQGMDGTVSGPLSLHVLKTLVRFLLTAVQTSRFSSKQSPTALSKRIMDSQPSAHDQSAGSKL